MLKISQIDSQNTSRNERRFRFVEFIDSENTLICERVIFEDQPYYKRIELLAESKDFDKMSFEGFITIYNKLDIVVLENESIEQSFNRNKYQLRKHEEHHINYIKSTTQAIANKDVAYSRMKEIFNYRNKNSKGKFQLIHDSRMHLEYEELCDETEVMKYYMIFKMTNDFKKIEVFRDFRPKIDLKIRTGNNALLTLKKYSSAAANT